MYNNAKINMPYGKCNGKSRLTCLRNGQRIVYFFLCLSYLGVELIELDDWQLANKIQNIFTDRLGQYTLADGTH